MLSELAVADARLPSALAMIENEVLFQLSQGQLIISKGVNERVAARVGLE